MRFFAGHYAYRPGWLAALLLTFCFSLAPGLQVEFEALPGNRSRTGSLMETLMGDSRQMFAQQFFVQADVYYHGGYYPSFFDQAVTNATFKITAQARGEVHDDHDHAAHAANEKHDADHCDHLPDFIKEPSNWIDRFGRHFYNTEHRHLGGEQTREILPWLKVAVNLDPHRVETYVVTAYWLRRHLHKIQEAEDFLRQGLRANPGNPELLFELGCLHAENRNAPETARNLWLAALKKCPPPKDKKTDPDTLLISKIAMRLARLEEQLGQVQSALEHLDLVKSLSPDPQAIQAQIDALKAKR